MNGNNAGIALGTNQVVELSGATTIAFIAGFAATGDGDERVLRRCVHCMVKARMKSEEV